VDCNKPVKIVSFAKYLKTDSVMKQFEMIKEL